MEVRAEKKHILKTFTWRIIATFTTTMIAWIITGDAMIGLKVGGVEFVIKMLLYYLHERAWHKIEIK
jgi:uncharacterized membrane protein